MDQKRAEVDSHRNDEDGVDRKPGGTVRLARSPNAATIDQPTHLVVCPVCQLKNPDAETFCAECGFLLTSKLEDFAALPSSDDLASYPHLEDASGRNYPLRPGVNTLGRENTDILIVDRSVSRYHGMIVYDEERNIFSVEDTGSTNGSQVNGEPLGTHNPRPIRPGDNLTFGNIALRFVAGGSGAVNATVPESLEPVETTLPNASKLISSDPLGRLLLLRGNGPREVLLEPGVTTIGRTADNKVCLNDDKYVSGHHAKIEADGDLFLLLDVGSTNGTFLNGLRMTTNTAIAISDSDEVLIGGLLFQFHRLTEQIHTGSDGEPTLLGAPSFDHLSAATIGDDTVMS
jgi:pSer/pThr/pTyr-binding forkhead associated (FHA) protein